MRRTADKIAYLRMTGAERAFSRPGAGFERGK